MDKRVNINKILTRVKHLMYFNLLIVFALKIFGLETFDINIENKRLLALFAVIDGTLIIKTAITLFLNFIVCNAIYIFISNDYKNNWKFYNSTIFIYLIVCAILIINAVNEIYLYYLSLPMYFVPLLKNKNIKYCLKAFLIDNLFTSISLFVMEVSVFQYQKSTEMFFIYSFDYYILWTITILERVSHMTMPNGSRGAKWDMTTTTTVAHQHNVLFEHITEHEWFAVLNMMYSDYYDQSKTGKPDEVPHYIKLAKDFLFDEDGKQPHEKVYCYWKWVVKH